MKSQINVHRDIDYKLRLAAPNNGKLQVVGVFKIRLKKPIETAIVKIQKESQNRG